MSSLRNLPWRAFAAAIVIGLFGGAVFAWMNLPLAWLLGSMVAVTIAASAGMNVKTVKGADKVSYGILGVVTGSAFSPEIFDRLGEFALTMTGLVFYVIVIAGSMAVIYRRVFRLDPATAYFSSMPGGLSEMIILGQAYGGDSRTIALFQSTRILVIALAVPIGFQYLAGYEPRSVTALGGNLSSISAYDYLILFGCILVGNVGGRWLRMPAPDMLGVLIVTAIVHLTGLTDAKLPFLIVAGGQLILGCAIGVRFSGMPQREILRSILIAGGTIMVMLAGAILLSFAVSKFSGWELLALVLAYAPGGLPELTLVALVMGVDIVFVAAHHTARIFMVVVLAVPGTRLLLKQKQPPGLQS